MTPRPVALEESSAFYCNSQPTLFSNQDIQGSWAGTTSIQEECELFVVSSYTDFDHLAHGPRGTQAQHSLHVYRFNRANGSMVLMHVVTDKIMNAAFTRFHPRKNIVYTCTEDIESNGRVIAYKVHQSGRLEKIGEQDAGGMSTCYITIDHDQKNIILVNYWDSTLCVLPLDQHNGDLAGPIKYVYDPKEGNNMKSSTRVKGGGCNHSNNDESTIKERQLDPHSHALILDPFIGCIAYVPDLGKDLIREFYFDQKTGRIECLGILPSGLCSGMPDGPRYIQFHPYFDIAYVVNELSSTIAVFSVDRDKINQIAQAARNGESLELFKGETTLTLIQSIKTVPEAFPSTINTCGRVCVHHSGDFVIVSNRGHQSIGVFRVQKNSLSKGQLENVGFYHTRGETPRHFQFDSSGQYLIVANQDSDNISIFTFDLSSGEIKFTGNTYVCPSPNFVCSCPLHDEDIMTSGNMVVTSEVPIVSRISDSNKNSSNFIKDKYTNKMSDSALNTINASSKIELEAALTEISALKSQIAIMVASKDATDL